HRARASTLHATKFLGSIPTWGAVGSGGLVLPRPSVLRWVISRAFLCGVCMFSPCSQGVSSTKKTCKRTEHSLSVPDQDRRFISPGPRALKKKLPTARAKGRAKIHGDLRPACACVCV